MSTNFLSQTTSPWRTTFGLYAGIACRLFIQHRQWKFLSRHSSWAVKLEHRAQLTLLFVSALLGSGHQSGCSNWPLIVVISDGVHGCLGAMGNLKRALIIGCGRACFVPCR